MRIDAFFQCGTENLFEKIARELKGNVQNDSVGDKIIKYLGGDPTTATVTTSLEKPTGDEFKVGIWSVRDAKFYDYTVF